MIAYLLATAFLGRGTRHRTMDPAIRDLGQAMAATSLAGAVAAFTFDAFSFLMFAGFIPLCLGVAGARGHAADCGAPNGGRTTG